MQPMQRVSISNLRHLLEDALVKRGCTQEDAYYVADDYLESELRGKASHGIIKFIKELEFIQDRQGVPTIIHDTPQFVLIDARREIGLLAARFATGVAIERAQKNGITIVGMHNMQRYGSLYRWVKTIAEAELIGIVTNTSEPVIAPPKGNVPVLGSNPLAVGIPTSKEPIVLDMATSKVSMSTLLQNIHAGVAVPQDTFFNKRGE